LLYEKIHREKKINLFSFLASTKNGEHLRHGATSKGSITETCRGNGKSFKRILKLLEEKKY